MGDSAEIMNIAFCFDKNYALGYLVTMVSLFENNKNEKFKVYIITPGLPDDIKRKFIKLSEIYGQELVFKIMSDRLFEGLPIYKPFNIATYYRYTIPILCEEKKLLQLDGDIIVRKNISELYNIDVSNVAMAVVEDQCSDEIQSKNRLQLDSPIFNNGVQLMNLDYWREFKIADKCKTFIINNPHICKYMDQDANNVILRGQVKFLPYTYNFQGQWFHDKENISMARIKWDEIDSFIKDPVIVHFSEPTKPWFHGCDNPFKNEFYSYARMYDFLGFKIHFKHSLLVRCAVYFFNVIGKKVVDCLIRLE